MNRADTPLISCRHVAGGPAEEADRVVARIMPTRFTVRR
ncbi:hypothetical protein J2S42_000836 [Catenuloplanes indicus]|uniref:Uncharacterized protein n=1 Tax=Catenuloplanes indicus TaxID=137267 RepID=A0AAE3VV28_9ACTN|nr:hypothetical protein [Catenuloplanes indicus]